MPVPCIADKGIWWDYRRQLCIHSCVCVCWMCEDFYRVLQLNNGPGSKMKQSDYLQWGIEQDWGMS